MAHPLPRLTAGNSVLVVIDVQDKLLAKIPTAADLVRNVGFLIDVAKLVGVPVTATEQYPKGLGPTTGELARRLPGDPTVRFLSIESRIRDRKDPVGALAELRAMSVPLDTMRIAVRHGLLVAEAMGAAGMKDSARLVLEDLSRRFPQSGPVRQALERLNP